MQSLGNTQSFGLIPPAWKTKSQWRAIISRNVLGLAVTSSTDLPYLWFSNWPTEKQDNKETSHLLISKILTNFERTIESSKMGIVFLPESHKVYLFWFPSSSFPGFLEPLCCFMFPARQVTPGSLLSDVPEILLFLILSQCRILWLSLAALLHYDGKIFSL